MGLFDWLFRSRRPQVSHNDAAVINLETIANDTDFTRDGSGSTVITGSVGHGVTMSIRGNSNVTIRGAIGSGCSILKEGSGALTIEGIVAENLKLTVYGQGPVVFVCRPPESVIGAIKNRGGVAQIFIGARLVLPPPRQGYIRHNLGAPAEQPVQYHPPLFRERPAPAAAPIASAVDNYPDITRTYIETFREHGVKTIAVRISELNLTEEETPLFDEFIEKTIWNDYFTDIPICYNETYYNLADLLKLYNENKPDPLSRAPLKLANIQPARQLLNKLDKVINELKAMREAAKAVDNEEQPGLSP
ncbi:MAG: hypothetical protein P4L65_09310 [Legionella sp.]|nr:hypothetical protein [Legionella sp.]